MEEKACKRSLRNTNPCNPLQNHFKNQKYRDIHCMFTPNHIISNLIKMPYINCEDINQMTFTIQETHKSALQSMAASAKHQQQLVHKYFPKIQTKSRKLSYVESITDQKANMINQPRLIGSEQGYSADQSILYQKMFRTQLYNLLLQ